jgi:hypothetical protein
LIEQAVGGRLTEPQADELFALGPEVAKLALLLAAKRIAELQGALAVAGPQSPSTPSGQKPLYVKPPAPKRKGKPGARKGHPGSHRPPPEHIDRREEHRLEVCPHCGGPLKRSKRNRTRTVEDILKDLRTEATEHTIYRDYCPTCKKHVEPVVPDALPNATLGNNLVALTAFLHYGIGVTTAQVRDLVGCHLHTRITDGGLISCWHRLGEILTPWCQEIAQAARFSAVLNADETGWRVNGATRWLWCFASKDACYYLIDPSRGTPALEKFFVEAFDGVLVHDFWAAYNHVLAGEHQCCLAHLLRELEKVDLTNDSAAWKAFAKKLRRLIRDGIRLRKRADFDPQRYGGLIRRIDRRLLDLARGTYGDADADRLAKRLLKHCDSLFTFLDHPAVPYDNNHGERMIRPAVIIRKNSQSNRSDKGAATQGILMSIFRTLKLRLLDPVATVACALRTYLTTGQLPSLPVESVADG